MRKYIVIAAALAAALALAGSGPAAAVEHYGAGAITGSISCAGGQAGVAIDSPAFVFNGDVGALAIDGVTSCFGTSSLGDGGVGDFSATGPGFSCAMSGQWVATGGFLQITMGGPCSFTAGGSRNMQFVGEAAIANGVFAGGIAFNPTA